MLGLWRLHFFALFVAEESNLDETIGVIDSDGVDCPPPNQDKVGTAIAQPKNNGLPAEMFKNGGDELMHQHIWKTWLVVCRGNQFG